MHALSVVLPLKSVIVFVTQLVQTCAPVVVLYVFAAHAVHVPPLAPVYPATHAQSVSASLCRSESALDGHKLHALCPELFAYVAFAHGVQGPPSGP